MRIVPLGVGSAFSLKHFQSNLLIESSGKNLLVDAGLQLEKLYGHQILNLY